MHVSQLETYPGTVMQLAKHSAAKSCQLEILSTELLVTVSMMNQSVPIMDGQRNYRKKDIDNSMDNRAKFQKPSVNIKRKTSFSKPSLKIHSQIWTQRDQTTLHCLPIHTLMRTSPAFGGATSTVSISRGFPGSQATAALQEITWNNNQKLVIWRAFTLHFTTTYLWACIKT